MSTTNSKQYSHAIYEIAKEENTLNKYFDLSLAILDVSKDMKLFEYLSSNIDIKSKFELIELITEDETHYKNWLKILIKSGRSKSIKNSIDEFIKLYNKEKNIISGVAWTTEQIDRKVLKEIESKISKKLDKNVFIENKIDKEIIGGIKLVVEDNIWDNTIKTKLKEMLNIKEVK